MDLIQSSEKSEGKLLVSLHCQLLEEISPFSWSFLTNLNIWKEVKIWGKKIYKNNVHRITFIVWIQSKSTVLCVLFWHNFIAGKKWDGFIKKGIIFSSTQGANLLFPALYLQGCSFTSPTHQQTQAGCWVLEIQPEGILSLGTTSQREIHLPVYVGVLSTPSSSSGEMKEQIRPTKQPLAGQSWKWVHF